MKKIYIAGKISGECETPELMEKCFGKFNSYIKWYSTHNADTVSFTHGLLINCVRLGKGTWQEYMKRDIAVLVICDEVHMLPDWKESKGANIERNLALSLGIKVIYV